jgi:hypothetical protein
MIDLTVDDSRGYVASLTREPDVWKIKITGTGEHSTFMISHSDTPNIRWIPWNRRSGVAGRPDAQTSMATTIAARSPGVNTISLSLSALAALLALGFGLWPRGRAKDDKDSRD